MFPNIRGKILQQIYDEMEYLFNKFTYKYIKMGKNSNERVNINDTEIDIFLSLRKKNRKKISQLKHYLLIFKKQLIFTIYHTKHRSFYKNFSVLI